MENIIKVINKVRGITEPVLFTPILTGSYSLKLLGLLNREPNDIDLILKTHTEDRNKLLMMLNYYFQDEAQYFDKTLVRCKIFDYSVDLIVTDREVPIIPLDLPFEIATPYETMAIKKRYTPEKYIKDFHLILNNFSK